MPIVQTLDLIGYVVRIAWEIYCLAVLIFTIALAVCILCTPREW